MLSLDPDIQAAMTAMADAAGEIPPQPSRGDWQALRQFIDTSMMGLDKVLVTEEAMQIENYSAAANDGVSVPLRWYKPQNSSTRAALLWTHGGGKLGSSLDLYEPVCKYYAARADVAILSVGFRLPPEHPFPVPVEDAYVSLLWLAEHADKLGVDPGRIGVAGDSGGGGIAAAIALMARDRGGPSLAKQFLLCPMLDDRNTEPDPTLVPFATWSYDHNFTGWQSFIGDAIGSDAVSSYAAPARETDFSNLPPSFIDIGELDIFRDETVLYATQLMKAGNSVELHVYPGVPHGFEGMAPESVVCRQAVEAKIRAFRSLND